MRKYIFMGVISALLASLATYACYDMFTDSSNNQQVACSTESCFMVHHVATEMSVS